MRIPSKGRYAVSAMLNLAINQGIGPVTIAEIAEKQAISLSYLEQLFARLRRAGLVEGTRGPGGGYRLAQSPRDISVAQVISAVDDISGLADRDADYLPFRLWNELSKRLEAFLQEITLADCLDNPEVEMFLQRHSEPDSALVESEVASDSDVQRQDELVS